MGSLFANQDISGFFQNAINKDFARQNLFRVVNITTPVVQFDESDLVYITATTLPARAITNVSVPFMGLKFNIPGTATYPGSEAWQVTFRIGQDLQVRGKLEAWSRSIFDDATSTGTYSAGSLGNVVLALYDKTGVNVIATYNLIGAYLQNLGTFTLNTTTDGAIVETQATLAYQYWTSTLAE
jgi:hypothetical protein